MGTDWAGGGDWAQGDHALRLDGLVRPEAVVEATEWQVLAETGLTASGYLCT